MPRRIPPTPPTKEIQANFFHANQPANQSVVPVNLDFGKEAFAIFKLPHDYHSMLVFNIYVEPNMDKADFSFRLSLYAAACGEDIPTHGGAADTTSKLIAGIYNCIDVKAKLPAVVAQLEAGDVLTVEVLNKEADNLLTAYLVNVKYE